MKEGGAHVLVDVHTAAVTVLVDIRGRPSGSMRMPTLAAAWAIAMIMIMMIVLVMIMIVAATAMRVVGVMMLAELDVSICAAVASQGVIGEEISLAGRISCRQ